MAPPASGMLMAQVNPWSCGDMKTPSPRPSIAQTEKRSSLRPWTKLHASGMLTAQAKPWSSGDTRAMFTQVCLAQTEKRSSLGPKTTPSPSSRTIRSPAFGMQMAQGSPSYSKDTKTTSIQPSLAQTEKGSSLRLRTRPSVYGMLTAQAKPWSSGDTKQALNQLSLAQTGKRFSLLQTTRPHASGMLTAQANPSSSEDTRTASQQLSLAPTERRSSLRLGTRPRASGNRIGGPRCGEPPTTARPRSSGAGVGGRPIKKRPRASPPAARRSLNVRQKPPSNSAEKRWKKPTDRSRDSQSAGAISRVASLAARTVTGPDSRKLPDTYATHHNRRDVLHGIEGVLVGNGHRASGLHIGACWDLIVTGFPLHARREVIVVRLPHTRVFRIKECPERIARLREVVALHQQCCAIAAVDARGVDARVIVVVKMPVRFAHQMGA